MNREDLIQEVKKLIIDTCELEDISADDIVTEEPLFNDGLGLDSIDALEIGVAIQKKYGVVLDAESSETKKHFRSVESLVDLIQSQAD